MAVLVIDETFAKEIEQGLMAEPKFLPTRYIYDERGSRLFEKIMALPEYYLTGCETEILKNNLDVFTELSGGEAFNLVELGAGNGVKTRLLIAHFLKCNLGFTYFPIDISEKALADIRKTLTGTLPEFNSYGLQMEYMEGLNWLRKKNNQRNLVLFLGANIGNLDARKLGAFLKSLHKSLNDGDIVVIGFDLVKCYQTIERAYNDSKGITKCFSLNLLHRMNRELDAEFNLDEFDYYNYYNPHIQANEAYIYSKKRQDVFIGALNKIFSFREWEPVHVEYSFKYYESQIQELAGYHGFELLVNLFDGKKYFCDSIWRVHKNKSNAKRTL